MSMLINVDFSLVFFLRLEKEKGKNMNRHSLRKRAVKRVRSLLASFPDEMQITGAAENATVNITEDDQNQGDQGQASQICDSEDDSRSDDDRKCQYITN